MKYRIVENGFGDVIVQFKYKYSPFWQTEMECFYPGHHQRMYFKSFKDAEKYVELQIEDKRKRKQSLKVLKEIG